jgi:hypothetical protein
VEKNKSFKEYLQDGILLCELVQNVRPDLIRKIKRVRSPFSWRENHSFFLEACKSLGLKGSQLFSPEDLIASGARTPTIKTKGFRGENERKLRNVAITIFWLSRVVRRLPNYTGPLLDFDPSSLGDWDSTEKLREGGLSPVSPVPATVTTPPPIPGTHCQSPPATEHIPFPSPPQLTSKSSSPSSSPPLPVSPYHSPTIKVKRVEASIPRTPPYQSLPPQVTVHVGGQRRYRSSSPPSLTHSRSNSLSDKGSFESPWLLSHSGKTRSTPALDILRSVHDQLSESEKVLSDLTKELTLAQEALALKRRSTGIIPAVEKSTSSAGLEKLSPESLPVPNGHQEEEVSLEESDSVSLEALIETELLLNSNKSPPLDLPHRSPSLSSSTPSDVSTIVPRDLVPSRCSALSLPEDPSTADANTSSQERQSNLCALSTATPPPSPVTADPEGFTNPLSNSSADGRGSPESNPFEDPTIEYSGSQTLFRNRSPVVDVEAVLGDLSDGAADDVEEEEPILFPSLTVSAPSLLPEVVLETSHDLLPPEEVADISNNVAEESEPERDVPSQDIDFLEVSPQFQRRPHPAVTTLKEDWRKSFHSSCSSLDSTACSVIEVTYCYNSTSDEVSSSHSPPQQDSTDANTSSCYSSSSEPEADGASYEVVPAETLNPHLANLSIPDPEESITSATSTDSKNLTRYNSLPNFEQADLETIPEEMAVTTQVMRIYPAQSVGEISSSVAVPHHRVHIPSSGNGPESPSKCTAAVNQPGIVYVSPTPSDESEMKVVREGSCVQVVEPPGLMATPIQILEDGEEEEEVDAQPVAPKDRKISRGLAPEPAFGKMNFTLSPVPVGGGSLARVQSDALPLTLHADMLTLPGPSTEEAKPSNRTKFADLSDFNSTAVEISSSDSMSSSRVSVATSNQSSSASLVTSQQSVSTTAIGELHTPIPSHGLRHYKNQHFLDNSFVDDILASSHGDRETDPGTRGLTAAKSGRPTSAPTRATSDSVLPSRYATDSPNILKIRSRRTSGEDKRQQRLANIAESARAALTYTAIHRSKKTESLPRDQYQLHHHWRSHSGSKSMGSEEELLGSSPSSVSILGKGSGAPAAPTDEAKTFTTGSPSGSLNLHSLSIDETRKASMTEMEEIWKLVENESGSSSTTSVDTSSEGFPGSSGGGGRRLPSIALESHLSPQHTASGKKPVDSPVFEEEDDVKKRAVLNGHAGLDVSVAEGVVKGVDQIPLQSTPRRPGLVPATPNMSLVTSGPRPSPVTRKDLDSLLTTLKSLGGDGGGEAEGQEEGTGLRLLEQMLHSTTFKRAQKVHDTVQQLVHHDEGAPTPVARRVVPIAQEARHHFHHHVEPSPEVDELRSLLREPHIQALMFCHDRVSSGDFYLPRRHFPRIKQDPVDIILSGSVLNFVPHSSLDNSLPLSRDVPSSRKEDATIVYLQRSNRPLGCTIYKQGEAVFVGKLLKGCDAELSEVLREGDEVLEVNGVPVMGRSTDEVVRLMSGEAGVTLVFTIIPIHDDNIDLNFEPKYVRAHFNYSPKTDDEIPCQPLGLRFEKGDILEISNQDDPDWWQARKVFDDGAESLPGLIPARHRQQQREALTRSYPLAKAMEDQHRKKKGLMSRLSRKKKKTVFYNQGTNQSMLAVGDEVVTYEDVMRMEPNAHWRRPIVVIGASGVGKGTLIRKLINSDHTRFAAVVQRK